jgi:hypothetical protein
MSTWNGLFADRSDCRTAFCEFAKREMSDTKASSLAGSSSFMTMILAGHSDLAQVGLRNFFFAK